MNEYSEFYLERVGHEANGKLRHKLWNGKNLIGRIDSEESSIGLDSLFCSRRHCVITVSDGNSVDIQDLNTTNGTTINGVLIKGETKMLDELDVIGVVGGSFELRYLVGNYNCYVYRLCKNDSNNLATIEVEDIETFEISDDDDDVKDELTDDSDVMCLDDSKLELNVNLADCFNAEIKNELKELDELEADCKQFNKKSSDFFQLESINEVQNEVNNIATLNPHQALDDVENINSKPMESDLKDSTGLFIHEEDESMERDHISQTNLVNGSLAKGGIDQVEGSDMFFQNIDIKSEVKLQAIMKMSDPTLEKQRPELQSFQKRRKSKSQTTALYKEYRKDKLKRVEDESIKGEHISPADLVNGSLTKCSIKPLSSDQVGGSDKCFQNIGAISEVNRAVMKVKKQRPKMIESLQKRRKIMIYDYPQNGKSKPQTSAVCKDYIKDKLKLIAAAKHTSVVEKPKEKTTPKVKNTIFNRGAFLTDPVQIPVLPRNVAVCRRKTVSLSKSCFTNEHQR